MNETQLAKLVKKPIRMCQSLHWCELCNQRIYLGERYYDGGYGRRAHVECVVKRATRALRSETEGETRCE